MVPRIILDGALGRRPTKGRQPFEGWTPQAPQKQGGNTRGAFYLYKICMGFFICACVEFFLLLPGFSRLLPLSHHNELAES